jgi:hypothetical protein
MWTEELFDITAIQYTNPITYKIKDMNSEYVLRARVVEVSSRYIHTEKVIRTKGNKMLVKWLGYPS